MESEATKGVATAGGSQAIVSNRPSLQSPLKSADNPVGSPQTSSDTLNLQNQALSKIEQAILKQLFRQSSRAVQVAEILSYSKQALATKQENSPAPLQAEIEKFVSDFQDPLNQALLELLKFKTVGSSTNKVLENESAKLKLLRLLNNLEDLPRSDKNSPPSASTSSKYCREILLQGMQADSEGDKVLLQNFLLRRKEIALANSEIIQILTKWEQSSALISESEAANLETKDQFKVISDCLRLLFSKSVESLENMQVAFSDEELSSLLLITVLKSQTFRQSIPEQFDLLSPEQALLPCLFISEIVQDLVSNSGLTVSEKNSGEPVKNEQQALLSLLKKILGKNVLETTPNLDIPNNTSEKKACANNASEVPTNIPSSDTFLSELVEKFVTQTAQPPPSQDFRPLSVKQLLQSQNFKLFLNSLDSNLKLYTTPAENNTPKVLMLIADLGYRALTLAVESSSPNLLRASTQFLKTSLLNKDASQAIFNLLISVFDFISSSSVEEDFKNKLNLKVFRNQLEELRNTFTKHPTEIKRNFGQVLEKIVPALNSLQESESPNTVMANKAELLEMFSQDSLKRLNNLAEFNSQPKVDSFILRAGNHEIPLEISFQIRQPAIEEKDQQTFGKDIISGTERIDCSLIFPKLGECGISLSLFENQLHLSISNQNSKVVSKTLQQLPKLLSRLSELNFDEPRIEVNCQKPKEVRPEWVLKLLGLN